MNLGELQDFCRQFKGVTEEFPFGDDTLVYKVMGKVFVLADATMFESINLKVDPEKSPELQETWAGVTPGYHMNKKHWITVQMDGTIPDRVIREWISESYNLVVKGLKKQEKSDLNNL